MFVVDDLVSWLVGQLADAGYQKLSTRLRGSEQDRALKHAVMLAVQATASEISPSDKQQADQLAERISGAFGHRVPVRLPPGELSRLEALRAGIAGQLSVLDDAGAPMPSPLGVSADVVADRLTAHLVYEISARGSAGGPLEPLANQLGHDLTHSQLEDLKGMVDRLLGKAGDVSALPSGPLELVGRPLSEVRDPFALEVHRPVEPDVPQPGLPLLPTYVPREHDAALAEVVTAAAAGTSGIVVLVGGSSTGKTRACWEALELLRGVEPGWRLWHPIDPSRPLAALRELPGIGPRTAVWLNEAQFFLDTGDGVGEQVAAGLRQLLRSTDKGPVLVLATLWPQYWDQLTSRPREDADVHAQARELLAGHDVPVPAAFTPDELGRLQHVGDPRLAQAATDSPDGQVIQYLAGAPELLARYRNAAPAAQALIHAAMDARRLGMRPALPRAFLEAAAPGYLSDTDWDLLSDDWLEQALAYTAVPSKGVRGPLTPIRPRPAPAAPADHATAPACRLADYLDQYGRRTRRELIPPAAFWAAAAACLATATTNADPAAFVNLAPAAEHRGLYRDAARLYMQASIHGSPSAAAPLIDLLHTLDPVDHRPASWTAAHVSLEDTAAVSTLLRALQRAEATDQVTTLLNRDPAAHVSLDDLSGVAELLDTLEEAGATDQLSTLASRAAANASLDDPGLPRLLLRLPTLLLRLHDAEAIAQVSTLVDALTSRVIAHTSFEDPAAIVEIWTIVMVGAMAQLEMTLYRNPAASVNLDNTAAVAELWQRDPAANVSLENAAAVAELLMELWNQGQTWKGFADQFRTLASRAAHVSLDDSAAVAELARMLRLFAADQFRTLASRAAAHVSLDDPAGVARLLDELGMAGATAQVRRLASRAAAQVGLDDPAGVAELLSALRKAKATAQVSTLLHRDPAAHVSLDDPAGVAELLSTLRKAKATAQVSTLLHRDPAAHVSLDNPAGMAELLSTLRKAKATAQVRTLATRAAHVSLEYPQSVAELLEALQEAGAQATTAQLIERLPGAGMFNLFCEQENYKEQFRFGREADGRPAKRWAWENLG